MKGNVRRLSPWLSALLGAAIGAMLCSGLIGTLLLPNEGPAKPLSRPVAIVCYLALMVSAGLGFKMGWHAGGKRRTPNSNGP